MGKRATVLAVLLVLGAAAPAAQAQNFWTGHRVLNIAHQGGENEAPSNTMYAYERALRLGADMLEVDIHTTADGRIVAMHDATVTRTTESTGAVYDKTLREVQHLDAAHDFVPGLGTEADAPKDSYAFRGIRTGERRPPPGYHRRDFRIPTLDAIMRAYPEVPINIEIKGRADGDFDSFSRNADALASFLNRIGRTRGIIVASFNDAALDRFHAQAPAIELAPAIGDVALFKLASVPLPESMVALQVPITFEGLTVTDRDLVDRAHAQDYAVHVWLSNDGENEDIYDRLLGWNVDGIMAAEPGRLEGVLCERGVARPDRERDWPVGRHCSPRSSIACDVRAVALERRAKRIEITLRRADDFAGRCAGLIRIATAAGERITKTRFDFGKLAPAVGGPAKLTVGDRLGARGRAALVSTRPADRLRVTATAYDAFPARARLRPTAAHG